MEAPRCPRIGTVLVTVVTLGVAVCPGPAEVLAQSLDPWCSEASDPGTVGTVTLAGELRIELRAAGEDAYPEEHCSVTVTDEAGIALWRAAGFRTAVYSPSDGVELDLDGDGTRDLLLMVDTGGGNRCCQTFHVFRIAPWTEIARLDFFPILSEARSGPPLVWELVPFYGLGRDMADAPVMLRVHRWDAGELRDVTAEHCDMILADELPGGVRSTLDRTALAADRLAAAARGDSTYEADETREAATSLALQYLACGQREEARRLVDAAWPAEAAAARWAEVASAASRTAARDDIAE